MSGVMCKRTCGCVDKKDQGNPAGVLLELTKWNACLPSHLLWGCRWFWFAVYRVGGGGEVSVGAHAGASFHGYATRRGILSSCQRTAKLMSSF